jgi:ABC-type Zn uptake system ZnuABC Zn-binding protein ZnuA
MSTALTPALRDQHEQAEARIEKNLTACRATWREIGQDLSLIRESRSYLVTHENFEDYCRERWGFSKTYANNLITAKETVASLPVELTTTVVTTERVARAVAKVEPSVRVEVVERAVEKAKERGSDRITARDVEEARKPADSVPCYMRKVGNTYVSWAQQYAQMAIDQLDKISDSDPERDAALGRVAKWLDKKLNK